MAQDKREKKGNNVNQNLYNVKYIMMDYSNLYIGVLFTIVTNPMKCY